MLADVYAELSYIRITDELIILFDDNTVTKPTKTYVTGKYRQRMVQI